MTRLAVQRPLARVICLYNTHHFPSHFPGILLPCDQTTCNLQVVSVYCQCTEKTSPILLFLCVHTMHVFCYYHTDRSSLSCCPPLGRRIPLFFTYPKPQSGSHSVQNHPRA